MESGKINRSINYTRKLIQTLDRPISSMQIDGQGIRRYWGWYLSKCLELWELYASSQSLIQQKGFHEGMLKWNSQDITKAKTIQASRKFRNRWPCQKFRVSAWWIGTVDAVGVASFDSVHCSIGSASFAPATLLAVVPQISQVLHLDG